MPYRGSPYDHLIPRLPGVLKVWDGMPLPPAGHVTPLSVAEVRERAARHHNVKVSNPKLGEEVGRWFHPITPGHLVRRDELRPDAMAAFDARYHPRGIRYDIGARTRAVAHLREHPAWTAASWSAASLLGIVEFSDGADSCFLCPGDRHLTTDALHATRQRRSLDFQPWTLHLDGEALSVAPPLLALAGCLRSVLSGHHAWEVPRMSRMNPEDVRAVQVIDQFRRQFGFNGEHIRRGLRGMIHARTLARLVAQSSGSADSPPETVMRLVSRRAVEGLGVDVVEQVPVFRDGRIGAPGQTKHDARLLTILDLAEPGLRIALMYDGQHHLLRHQRDRDARITAELTMQGWWVLRVSAGMLRDVETLTGKIRAMVTARTTAA